MPAVQYSVRNSTGSNANGANNLTANDLARLRAEFVNELTARHARPGHNPERQTRSTNASRARARFAAAAAAAAAAMNSTGTSRPPPPPPRVQQQQQQQKAAASLSQSQSEHIERFLRNAARAVGPGRNRNNRNNRNNNLNSMGRHNGSVLNNDRNNARSRRSLNPLNPLNNNNNNNGALISQGVRQGRRIGAEPRMYYAPNGRLAPNEFVSRGVLRRATTAAACVSLAVQHGVGSPEFQTCFAAHLRALRRGGGGGGGGGAAENPCDAGAQTAALARHQTKMYELAKVIAEASERGGTDRGQLLWVNTGGGKTVMALSILLAYWDTPKRLFVITTPQNKKDNNPEKYIENLRKFFPRHYEAIRAEYGGDIHRAIGEHRPGRATAGHRVEFLSFETAGHMLDVPRVFTSHRGPKMWEGQGSVAIIDEAHALSELLVARGRAEQDVPMLTGQKFRSLSPAQRQKLHIYGLTATPGLSIKTWLQLLSVVRRADPTEADFSATADQVAGWVRAGQVARVEAFLQRHADGLVTAVDVRDNLRFHACVKEETKLVPVDRWYYAASLLGMHGAPAGAEVLTGLKMSDAVGRKEYGVLVPKKVLETVQKRGRILADGTWVSNKVILLTKHLAGKPGKHMVYTSVHPALLAQVLRAWYGMQDVTASAVASGEAYTTSFAGASFAVLPDTKAGKDAVIKAFNSARNDAGAQIKIMVVTGRSYEGTDLKGLRFVHLMEPMDSALKETQAVGRGVRLCAHSRLASADRTVTIVRWYTTPPTAEARREMREFIERHHAQTPSNRLALALAAVAVQDRIYGATGFDRGLRKTALRDPAAVELFNFQEMVWARATRGTRPSTPFRPYERVYIRAGRRCS